MTHPQGRAPDLKVGRLSECPGTPRPTSHRHRHKQPTHAHPHRDCDFKALAYSANALFATPVAEPCPHHMLCATPCCVLRRRARVRGSPAQQRRRRNHS